MKKSRMCKLLWGQPLTSYGRLKNRTQFVKKTGKQPGFKRGRSMTEEKWRKTDWAKRRLNKWTLNKKFSLTLDKLYDDNFKQKNFSGKNTEK